MTTYVCTVEVIDPDTGNTVIIEIRKDDVSGAMVGIDGSYLENTDNDVYSPYNFGERLEIPDNETREIKTYLTVPVHYLVHVEGCVEPELRGPFGSVENRNQAALALRKTQSDEDALFWLDVRDGNSPVIGAFTGGFFEEDPPALAAS